MRSARGEERDKKAGYATAARSGWNGKGRSKTRETHLQVEREEIVGCEEPPAVADAVCSRVRHGAHAEWAARWRCQSLC